MHYPSQPWYYWASLKYGKTVDMYKNVEQPIHVHLWVSFLVVQDNSQFLTCIIRIFFKRKYLSNQKIQVYF